MTTIPVTIHLDGDTFRTLEAVAKKRGTNMRALIVAHLRHGLTPEPHSRTITAAGKPVERSDVDAWIEAARMGVTNRIIAQRWGVTEQLVSRCLNERGIYRQKRRADYITLDCRDGVHTACDTCGCECH